VDKFYVMPVPVWGNPDVFGVVSWEDRPRRFRRLWCTFKSRDAAYRECARRNEQWNRYRWAMVGKQEKA
jgi:hypothetical protein